jgi:hypothetical protein
VILDLGYVAIVFHGANGRDGGQDPGVGLTARKVVPPGELAGANKILDI